MSDGTAWRAVHDPVVTEVLTRHYGIADADARALNRDSLNSVWRVSTPDGRAYTLKRFGRDVNPQWLTFVTAAEPRLAAAGIRFPVPLPTAQGGTSAMVDGSVWQLRDWQDGRAFDATVQRDFTRAGEFLSTLHRIDTAGLPAGGHCSTRNLEFWLEMDGDVAGALDEVDEIVAPHVTAEVRARARAGYASVVARARDELSGYADLPVTLTHGEVAGSNLLYDESGDLSSVLDWDGVQLRSRVYDIARATLFLGRQKRGSFAVDPDRVRWIVDAATAHRPLDDAEMAAIVPVLELDFVPAPDYVRQVAKHAPGHLEWYVGWRARGATSVREILNGMGK